jgi:membrane associated rhomboid family serine protease
LTRATDPPRFFDPTRTPIVAVVVVAALAVFAADLAQKDVTPLQLDVRAFMGEPWRIVTTMLPHVDFLHLAFNLLWLVRLGRPIEARIGSPRFLALVVVLGGGAALAEYALGATGVGLSGVGYGLVAMAWVARHDPRFSGIVDRRTAVLFVAWFFFCILTTVTGALAVANYAHAAGALLGALAGWAVTTRSLLRRVAFLALAAAFVGASWLGATRFHPQVTLSARAGGDAAYLGWKRLEAREDAAAEPLLREAVRMAPRNGGYWFNLGISLERQDKHDEALEAYRRSRAAEPGEAKYTSAFVSRLRAAGMKAHEAGDFDGAARAYAEALAITPDEPDLIFLEKLAREGRRPSQLVPP